MSNEKHVHDAGEGVSDEEMATQVGSQT